MNTVSNKLLDALKTACAKDPISYRDYIDLVLYSEGCGYYKRDQKRVGRSRQTDFYTAESLGNVFARLVTTAAFDLLGKDAAAESAFVEIAAEPGTELLSHLEQHPFADSQVIRQGDPVKVNGPVVIFANEWLDALPFHRLIFKDNQWRERGVAIDKDLKLSETLLDTLSPEVAAIRARLPNQAPEGYQLDLPLLAEAAVADLMAQNWTGLILLFDYGKTWQTLTTECSAGTARTYKQHKQGNNLLDSPGAKDITCDICWDPLVELLGQASLESVTLESQEAFLVKRAQRATEAIVRDSAGSFSSTKQTLMELIHPTHMGQRFQVLWGLRTE